MKLGATVLDGGKVEFRVWAPQRKQVEVCLETPQGLQFLPLEKKDGGYFVGTHPASVGTRYKYRLDRGECFADPASRFQPDGPHGPSEIVDPRSFQWTDGEWKGPQLKGQVLYELHVGTFTQEGTYAGVAAKLPYLRDLGVTAIELMPLHTAPGRFNWGYDGVSLYAPNPNYGRPDDLRRLIDEAHRLGMSVVLDVVYNHLGPDGNYLSQFSKDYFTDKYPPEWGQPIAFEGETAKGSREFFVQNAEYWIGEFHFDGLRLDATQNLFDSESKQHVMSEIAERARAAATARSILVIAENEPQDVKVVTPRDRKGHGLDAVWMDDFHHSARVAVAGRAEAYLKDYRGTSQELLSCALRNSLYQGQFYSWQDKTRGSPLRQAPPEHAVIYLQNHDQLANMLKGERLHKLAGEARTRALTCALLLFPQTPMLFMGQEFFSSSPFLYFVDFHEELQEIVRKGRNGFLSQFPSSKHAIEHEGHVVPFGDDAFKRSTLDWSERETNAGPLNLHRDLLKLRREDPCFSAQDPSRLAGAVLSDTCFVLRYFGTTECQDRLLIVNLGSELKFDPCPEPLLAPEPECAWHLILSSEGVRYGGNGGYAPDGLGPWELPGNTALVLASGPRDPSTRSPASGNH